MPVGVPLQFPPHPWPSHYRDKIDFVSPLCTFAPLSLARSRPGLHVENH
ncbi:hypothetical protein JMJ77_0007790 [Colletotrichum scovillei]|uniref:Uncharacterized protein n=1 Tax=Colletotrichum scovillei TaxID=1209932 RepID=A0A9P7UFW1_9PEZI|nr:hypothetical protein JMJ77_0007790 [Colletotrichum scovillei]KAG7074772.1 hypothetical protein JMJ76_0011243 [Colletotrichum scovillei]KAG7081739.1 hypothetical protein JMJ78_0003854 [Colletotrichum scovillei]